MYIYGLCDASRHWYLKVCNVMIEHGTQVSNLDQAIFYRRKENSLHGLLAAHVDDFFGAGTPEFEAPFISKIKSSFLVGSEETQGFKYIGSDLEQSLEFITLDQASYIDQVSQIPLSRSRAAQKHESLDKKEHEKLHSLIGHLN